MRFGTDGVRGVANAELTVELVLALGRASARIFGGPRVLVGRDPRRSGPMLEAALAAGIAAEGVDVGLLGVVPTPAVAAAAAAEGVAAAMISASHNPFADNGVKLFAPGGRKLDDATQAAVEAEVERVRSGHGADAPTGAAVGEVRDVAEVGVARYLEHLAGVLEGRDLQGLSVVLDAAHGAAAVVGPEAFRRAGAEVRVIGDRPDGTNINDGHGSTHPGALADAVVASGAPLGFAFDGDADRVLAVDGGGRLIDGDQLMAMAALDLRDRDRLRNDAVAVTVMTNLGFRRAMAEAGIGVVETPVGDRHVLEAIDRHDLSLGGEQSGHLIFRDAATTGDGLLSALVIADLVVRAGRPLGELADSAMTRLPQVLRNVATQGDPASALDRLAPLIVAAEAALGAEGRVLVRASGTEALIRVMVEAGDEETARRWADELAAAV